MNYNKKTLRCLRASVNSSSVEEPLLWQ